MSKGTGNIAAARKGSRPVYQSARDRTIDYTVYDRRRLLYEDIVEGPAIIEEPSSTTILHPVDRMRVGQYGELRIELSALSSEFLAQPLL